MYNFYNGILISFTGLFLAQTLKLLGVWLYRTYLDLEENNKKTSQWPDGWLLLKLEKLEKKKSNFSSIQFLIQVPWWRAIFSSNDAFVLSNKTKISSSNIKTTMTKATVSYFNKYDSIFLSCAILFFSRINRLMDI